MVLEVIRKLLLDNGIEYREVHHPRCCSKWAGLVPGSVPSFGKPVLPFDLYGDSLS